MTDEMKDGTKRMLAFLALAAVFAVGLAGTVFLLRLVPAEYLAGEM